MTVSPDDLPRSPTGRIPRWVVDEAAAVVAGPTVRGEHGAHPPPAGSVGPVVGGQRRSRRRPVRAALAGALVLALLAAGFGGGVVSPEQGQALAHRVGGWAQAVQGALLLPPASRRTFPAPGFEEAADRLAAPPSGVAASSAYAFAETRTDADGRAVPVTWSPCRPIHYVIDTTGAPPELPAHVATVLAEITAATGLVFADDGPTTEAAELDRSAFQPALYGDRWAPVLIRFADAATVPQLAGEVAGLGGGTTYEDPLTGARHYVSGLVYLDTEILAAPARPEAPAYVPVLRHELGHLVGLGHVEDAGQLMNAVNTGHGTFQAGDLAGLALLGQGPCAAGL